MLYISIGYRSYTYIILFIIYFSYVYPPLLISEFKKFILSILTIKFEHKASKSAICNFVLSNICV